MKYPLALLVTVTAAVMTRPALADSASAGALYHAAMAQQGKSPAAYVAQLRQAAQAGSTAAMNRLGMVYERGAAGQALDPAQAATWFRKSADAGSAYGGWLYAQARAEELAGTANPDAAKAEVQPLMKLAIERAGKQAALGDLDGMLALGLAHRLGIGAPRDIRLGESWLAKAAARGDDEAMLALGDMYASDEMAASTRTPYKPQAGLALLKQAAASGNTLAMRLVGDLLLQGRMGAWTSSDGTARYMIDPDQPTPDGLKAQIPGVARKPAEAVIWYRKAIAGGDAAALQNMAVLYLNGTGVPKDPGEALKLMRSGAERGMDVSMYGLGTMYRDGLGVEKNTETAADWYRKAAALGNQRAKDALAKLGTRAVQPH